MQYWVFTMRLRLLELEFLDNPRMSLAVEEAIFRLMLLGKSPPTFWFWRHRNAVIIGKFQVAEEEVNMEIANQYNVQIAKRDTGGGAVYQDLGNLIYSVIVPDHYGISSDVVRMYELMINPVLLAFKKLGVKAESPGLNDVEIGGRKVLGSAAGLREGGVLFHATMLIRSNLEMLAKVLKVPRTKLQDKGVTQVSHRVGNVYDLTGRDMDEVKRALLDGYSEYLNFEFYRDELTEREYRLAEYLYNNKYNRPEWVFSREFIRVEIPNELLE
jgi:lipoate-protein ligase A